MKPVPAYIAGARVLAWSPIDGRHRATGQTKHIVDGRPVGPAAGIAICKYDNDTGFYLFGCDESWDTITDTLHATFDEAKDQAESEYVGSSRTWQSAG